MARPSKRLVLLLSLSLLLQLFAPAYTGHLSKKRVSHSKKFHDDEDEDENQAPARRDENAGRRGVISLIGKYLLKSVDFVSQVTTKLTAAVDLALTITQAIAGCGGLFSKLDENWKKYEKLDAEFRTISDDIDAQNNQATSRQIYTNSSFYEYRTTRDNMQDVANEQERVFRSLGPNVLIALQNTSFEIEQYMKEHNNTQEQIGLLEVDRRFKTGLELALGLIFPSAVLAWPGVKKVWKHIKGTVIGKKINQLEQFIGGKLKAAEGSSTAAVKKVTAGKFMKTAFGQKIQRLITRSQGKFDKAQKIFEGVQAGLGAVLKLGIAAFGVWSIFASVKVCKDAADKSEKSVSNMTEFVNQNKEMLVKMKDANLQVQQAFDEIREAAWDEYLLDALESIKEMMSDPQVAETTEDNESIVGAIQAYIDGKDIDANIDNNKLTLSELQRNLNAALHRVPLTLGCHRIIGETFQAVSFECGSGASGTLAQVYDKVKRIKGIVEDTESGCTQKTGSTFVNFDNIKQAWEKWVSTNETYKAPCLMNNKFVVDTVREQLQNGERDVNKIAREANEADGVEEIQVIIDELLKDPSINELPKATQKIICQFQDLVNKNFITVEQALSSINGGETRKVTKEEFENQICPVPADDEYLSKNSNDSEKDDNEDDDEKEE